MKILFITFAKFGSNESHLSRLRGTLEFLSENHEISICHLGDGLEDERIKAKFPRVRFYDRALYFDGWSVRGLDGTIACIEELVGELQPDIVIQTLEIWDIIRELSIVLGRKKIPFATVFHAMPFVAAPNYVTGDFCADVISYCASGVEEYRANYVQEHWMEAYPILNSIKVIAANVTVLKYFHGYFPGIPVRTLANVLLSTRLKPRPHGSGARYDLLYVARMERGKGMEFFEDILPRVSQKIGRPLSVAIAGRTDDEFSASCLERLRSYPIRNVSLSFLGWVGDLEKDNIFRDSKVFMYPSHYDTYGIVIAEALAYGLPCVTWDLPFVKNSFSEFQGVFRAKFSDSEGFSKLCADLILDYDNGNKIEIGGDEVPSLEKAGAFDEAVFISLLAEFENH